MTMDPRFLTPKEIAEILGVHQKTVHHWLRIGKLAGTKISYRTWRISHSALEDFVAQNSNTKPKTVIHAIKDKDIGTPESIHQNDTVVPMVSETVSGSRMKHYIREIMEEDSSVYKEEK
ncbi:MAG: helix-turn-helix domain-containing protein [Methanoregula sp.]|jgi:excisionase family DNA binding protein|uniref:helix-turn-helix domain-containing protein n=1 Tax=Methanoregula sp. TaxID=2052170 RepID=UPI003C1C979F